ncbi:unnamed protein product [Callosobruchus maculatus]|uniref:G-protein coupled receptors family 1 profile domain-containing protein n=1 Tax=Callosobruchus maculatus TaxID=64391 RepID=A0A653DSF9_CALMS|nr:unnamed protein product [Callosobruchus maculatus]
MVLTRETCDEIKSAVNIAVMDSMQNTSFIKTIVDKVASAIEKTLGDKFQNLYAWLAIFVLPINSALNPVLYTLTTTIFKKQMSKMIHSCWNKRKRCDHQTASESALSLSLGGGTQSSSLLASKNSWKRSTAV